jgi:transglutaminase-like putative cysteine protease
MARPSGTTRPQRLTALVAMLLLAATTAVAIGRVFEGHGPTWRLLGAALAAAALSVAMERRHIALAALAALVFLVVALGVLVFPNTTWYGLPTLDTLRAIREAAGLVTTQAQVQVAPTPALKPLLMAALTGAIAAVFSAHALAFRAGSPLLALVPPIALVAFADTVLEEQIRPIFGIAFLVAALAVVFADGLRRVQGWGPMWVGRGRAAKLDVNAGRGARRVGAAVVATAIAAPLLIPGVGSRAVIDLSSVGGDDRVGFDIFVSVRDSLQQDEPTDILRVDAALPAYLRMVALDLFDGNQWAPSAGVGGQPLESGSIMGAPVTGAVASEATVTVLRDLRDPWLPIPYPTTSVSIDGGLRFDPETGTASLDAPLDEGAVYSVRSAFAQPTPAELEAAFPPPADFAGRYTQLPPDLPAGIEELARRWTAEAETPYEKALAIQGHLTDTSRFAYDADVPAQDDSFTLLDFLTKSRRGFCQQYAAAMAVMLRTLGIPARVAVGFTAGSPANDEGTVRTIASDDAHAWTEVFFPGSGWLAFEPTPGRTNPVAAAYASGDRAACAANLATCAPGGTGSNPGDGPLDPGTGVREGAGSQQQLGPDLRGGARRDPGAVAPLPVPDEGFTWRDGFIAMLALAALALALFPLGRSLRRRARLRRAGTEPRRLILATYDVFGERVAELGLDRPRAETIDEFRCRLDATGRVSGPALDRLTSITRSAAYAPDEPTDAEAQVAREAASATLRELRRATPVLQRVAGRYRRPV